MRIAVGQFTATADVARNLCQCVKIAEQAKQLGAQVENRISDAAHLWQTVFLPEASDFIVSATQRKPEWPECSRFVNEVAECAKRLAITVVVGIHEPCDQENATRCFNALLVIDQSGQVTEKYRKIHLFDVDLSPDGPVLLESDSVAAGESTRLARLQSSNEPSFILGMAIVGMIFYAQIKFCLQCYDVRFPELARELVAQGATILTFPSAFTVATEILLRARAIECQCYVVASAQIGQHAPDRSSWGQSMVPYRLKMIYTQIVDPWGKIIAQCPSIPVDAGGLDVDAVDVAVADIDPHAVIEARRKIPLLHSRNQRKWHPQSL